MIWCKLWCLALKSKEFRTHPPSWTLLPYVSILYILGTIFFCRIETLDVLCYIIWCGCHFLDAGLGKVADWGRYQQSRSRCMMIFFSCSDILYKNKENEMIISSQWELSILSEMEHIVWTQTHFFKSKASYSLKHQPNPINHLLPLRNFLSGKTVATRGFLPLWYFLDQSFIWQWFHLDKI